MVAVSALAVPASSTADESARVAERFEASGGYLLQLRPRPGGDTYTHVPQLSAAYRF